MADFNKIMVTINLQDLFYLTRQSHIAFMLMEHPNMCPNREIFYVTNVGYQLILLLNVTLIFYYLKLSQYI